jgi:hypothetical protein
MTDIEDTAGDSLKSVTIIRGQVEKCSGSSQKVGIVMRIKGPRRVRKSMQMNKATQ